MNFKQTGEWQRSLLPEDVDKGIATEHAAFGRLRVRIRDGEARKLAAHLSEAATAALLSPSQQASRTSMMAMTDHLIAMNERSGVLLRELEVDEDTMVGLKRSRSFGS